MNFFKKKQQSDLSAAEPTSLPDSDKRMSVDSGGEEGEGEGELFEHLETSENGLFDGMDSVPSPRARTLNNNNNNLMGFDTNIKTKQQSEDEDDDYDEEEDDDDVTTQPIEGMYDPEEFSDLPVGEDIRDLFDYILRYAPQKLELDSKLKPFIPEFIPAVGDIDAFIKVDSENPLELGLTVLDEPTARQSDPNIMELQLRSLSKRSSGRLSKVKKVVNLGQAQDNKVVQKWIKDIDDLHRSKPPPTVQYSKPMPDIDLLMAEWPQELDTLLGSAGLPTAALDISLESYVDIICAILDIPIYKSRIQVSLLQQGTSHFIFHCRPCMFCSVSSPHLNNLNTSTVTTTTITRSISSTKYICVYCFDLLYFLHYELLTVLAVV